ncbi:acid-shock protein [Enterobacteriaceae bacterium ESL0689]|nr:acid-shock protein [Enterobacteriaceae bacterium ESL0689]
MKTVFTLVAAAAMGISTVSFATEVTKDTQSPAPVTQHQTITKTAVKSSVQQHAQAAKVKKHHKKSARKHHKKRTIKPAD